MSDSEDDALSSNVYSFPNDRTTIHAKGPNYENMSCRNNFLTTTMHASRNYDRRNLNYDQRSLYYKRDTSPISLRSVPDCRPKTFRYPYSMGAASYQQSIINGRSCSPTSVRSIDTNVSMSATDVALAIKSEAYNKHDLRLIKEALDRQLKMKLRRRVEKRRNHRLLKHMSKLNTDDDSGEHGSDSSFDDDCRSIRTAPSMANYSKYKTTLNLTNMKKTFNEGNMYNDRTEDMRRKSFINMISPDGPEHQNSIKSKKTIKSNSVNGLLLKNRFKTGILLPSQRFNKCTSSNLSRINNNNVHSNQISNAGHQVDVCVNGIPKNNLSEDMESEQEEIFSEITAIERNSQTLNNSHKRTIDPDELPCNPQKKSKVTSTQIHKSSNEVNCTKNDIASDFIFAKPQMPVRKSGNKKIESHSPEILLAQSRQPLYDIVEYTNTILPPVKEIQQKSSKQLDDIEIVEKKNRDEESVKQVCTSYDSSMQPSFFKRKLFTQKLDMAEKKNISDSSLSSSPHVKNINSNKERNKARRLASSQSCLSRDVLEEDNNFLHLLHKIVPADQINVTNASNKIASNRNSQRESNDKWDVTSVISNCCQNDISDTYTDDEIFKVDDTRKNKSKFNTNTKTQSSSTTNTRTQNSTTTNTRTQNSTTTNCKIVLEKLPLGQLTKATTNIAYKQTTVKKPKEFNKENTNVRLNAYWDTDTESELEIYESSCNLNDSQNNNKVDKSINSNKNCKKLQSHKAECTPVEATKTLGVKNKSQKGTNIKKTTSAGIKKSTKSNKKNISQESKENNNNLLNISLSSNRNIQEINKPTETCNKTVMLISHRMGKPKRQVKPKKMNTIESPSKDSDISSKEKEKPTETFEATAIISHRTARSKSQVRPNETNPVESPPRNDTSNSNSELNISIKSLRSYDKNAKVARNLRSRNSSGVKGI